MEWIEANSETVNILLNLGMLLVWIGYAQLFFFQWLQQRRPMLVVSASSTKDLNAECLICNMAHRVCFIEVISLCMKPAGGGGIVTYLKDLESLGGGIVVTADNVTTQHLHSRRERRKVDAWLREFYRRDT